MRRMKRSEEHTSELQSPIDISYAVFCLKKKKYQITNSDIRNDICCIKVLPLKWKYRTQLIKKKNSYFFFNDTATTDIYTSIDTLSLHDALPIYDPLFAVPTDFPDGRQCGRGQ